MICYLAKCGIECGTQIICVLHRKLFRRLSDYTKRQIWVAWHDAVCEPYRVDDMFRCHHCGELFARDYICGDHYPLSKGASPQTKFDTLNGVACCMRCNQSDNTNRRKSNPKSHS